jgi:hypothetical protein
VFHAGLVLEASDEGSPVELLARAEYVEKELEEVEMMLC